MLQGFDNGRREELTETVVRLIRSPLHRGMLGVIQSDSVYTPAREHTRWGVAKGCQLCGGDIGTLQHKAV